MRLTPLVAIFVSFSATAVAAPVTFEVEVPHCTPAAETIFLRSNRSVAGQFLHDALTRVDATHYRGTFDVVTDRGQFEYKYSHGLCDMSACPGIEKGLMYTGSGGDIAPRMLSATATSVADLVFIWRSALRRADGSERAASEMVGFCGPYLVVSDERGLVTISVDAYDGELVQLEYGRTTAYGTTMMSTSTHRNHFQLNGLEAGASYHYRLTTGGAVGPDQTFRAPPAADAPFKAAFFGDSQFYAERDRIAHRAIAEQLITFDPDVMLAAGDLVASEPGATGPGGWDFPEMARWNVFFGVMAPLMSRAPLMAAMGNHEEDAPYFWDVFDYPEPDHPRIDHYWFRYGNMHVTVLYTGSTDGYDREGILDAQTPWLIATLDAANLDPSIRWKVVLLHRGPFSQGANHPTDGQGFYDSATAMRESWGQVWQSRGVDLVLAGHNHNLTLAENAGVHYLTACSGAPVHPLRTPFESTTLYAESTCSANMLSVTAKTLSIAVNATDGSPIAGASVSLCRQNTDCAELPNRCPSSVIWSCQSKRCSSVCVEETLALSPASLTLTAIEGQTSATATVSVTGSGGGSLPWSASCPATWMNCTPSSGSTPARISVTANAGGLTEGRYDGAIIVGGSTVAVTLTVSKMTTPPRPNRAPTTPVLKAPSNGALVEAPAVMAVEPSIDPDGDAVQYEFRVTTSNVVVFDGQTNLTSLRVGATLGLDRTYMWSVRALDARGAASDWSAQWSFVITTAKVRAPADTGCDCRTTSTTTFARPSTGWALAWFALLIVVRRRKGSA